MTVMAHRAAAAARAGTVEHLSREERVAQGKDARAVAPLESHAEFAPAGSRDPVGLLLGQAKSRVPELVPVRHGRMLVSAFTFYRGAALPMAADLATTPTSGLQVQLCGDAHLSNFGAFASPERRLVFDVNDFDETLPGPFEWDVKRLAASFVVAGRDNGFSAKDRRKIALAAAEAYRTAMRGFAEQPLIEVWYAHLDIEDAIGQFRSQMKAKRFKAAGKLLAKTHTRDSTQALDRLTTISGGQRRIISDPPMIVPVEEVFPGVEADALYNLIRAVLGKYRRTLQSDRRHLLEQFTLVQVARKVVGVGSVGTRAWILLMEAGDGTEPLFLQAKEAQPSVLADYCERSQYTNQGERVVAGQHLMQAQSDIFLGWTRVPAPDGVDRDFYVRQLRDWKFSFPIEVMFPAGLTVYAGLCGWTLARAHARSGDRIALAAYLGGSAKFDQAIADFAETYADQNERDYAALQAAVKDGKAEASTELLGPGDGGNGDGGDGDGGDGGDGGENPPDQRFFIAELEDHSQQQPLVKGDQYTIAFSVGASSRSAIGQTVFPDETLAAADEDIDVFEFTVQLDSDDDFEILSESTRPLRVPRTGRSLGKARFEIAPRRNGRCRLVANVHYRGNFVHEMQLIIPVGGRKAVVKVSSRGRTPDSAGPLKPRDISIQLEPKSGGGFWCTALASVGVRAPLPITKYELAAAVDSTRDAMMKVIRTVSEGQKVFQTGIDIPKSAQDSALRTLASAGSRLYQKLFLHPGAGDDARAVGEWLRGYALNPGLRLTLQVVADQAPLPWAMLYLGDASDGAKLDWNYFLGMRHILEQLPLQPSLDTTDNEITSKPSLAVSVNLNTSIDASMGITLVKEHQKHWTDTAKARAGLTLVSRSTKNEVVRALADRRTGDQVLYFYCHATARPSDPDSAAIIMGKNDAATLADLNLNAPTTVHLARNPLVFINACESAELSPLFYNGFVPYFMAKGSRGVIGTECKTPVLFAIEWANAFFDKFLDGAAVGETVLELRQDFLRRHGNPLGLIYAIHCDADTRVTPALARAKAQRKRKTS